jgi:hypothetical protein
MFGIFNRLSAQAGDPPDEDRVGPAGSHGVASSSRAAHEEFASWLRAVLIPAALLMIIIVVFTVTLSGRSNCGPMDRANVFTYHTAQVTTCERAQVTKAIATINH